MPLRRVELIFPDTMKMTEFILKYKVNNVHVNSKEKSLVGVLTHELINIARKEFNATLPKVDKK